MGLYMGEVGHIKKFGTASIGEMNWYSIIASIGNINFQHILLHSLDYINCTKKKFVVVGIEVRTII